jgi:hypothetical protein
MTRVIGFRVAARYFEKMDIEVQRLVSRFVQCAGLDEAWADVPDIVVTANL